MDDTASLQRGLKPGVGHDLLRSLSKVFFNNTILQDKLTAVATNLHGLSVASGGICDLNLKSDAFMRTNLSRPGEPECGYHSEYH